MIAGSCQGFVRIECMLILKGMEKERRQIPIWQRWKTRKEYKRKRERVLSLMAKL